MPTNPEELGNLLDGDKITVFGWHEVEGKKVHVTMRTTYTPTLTIADCLASFEALHPESQVYRIDLY